MFRTIGWKRGPVADLLRATCFFFCRGGPWYHMAAWGEPKCCSKTADWSMYRIAWTFAKCWTPTVLFPTCQVWVVRFYQSCCPPPPPPLPPSPPPPPPPVSPRPCLHQLPPPLPPCQLFAKLFANFRAQCALLDLNLGPSQLSARRWTPTWDLPSSVRTAGPQPGTFPAQCAPLDLNGQIECQKICQIERQN